MILLIPLFRCCNPLGAAVCRKHGGGTAQVQTCVRMSMNVHIVQADPGGSVCVWEGMGSMNNTQTTENWKTKSRESCTCGNTASNRKYSTILSYKNGFLTFLLSGQNACKNKFLINSYILYAGTDDAFSLERQRNRNQWSSKFSNNLWKLLFKTQLLRGSTRIRGHVLVIHETDLCL